MQDTKSIKLFNQDLIRLRLRHYFFVLGSSAPFFPSIEIRFADRLIHGYDVEDY
jgi:hypothetical protein